MSDTKSLQSRSNVLESDFDKNRGKGGGEAVAIRGRRRVRYASEIGCLRCPISKTKGDFIVIWDKCPGFWPKRGLYHPRKKDSLRKNVQPGDQPLERILVPVSSQCQCHCDESASGPPCCRPHSHGGTGTMTGTVWRWRCAPSKGGRPSGCAMKAQLT